MLELTNDNMRAHQMCEVTPKFNVYERVLNMICEALLKNDHDHGPTSSV